MALLLAVEAVDLSDTVEVIRALDIDFWPTYNPFPQVGECSSAVERQLPKLNVTGSSPVTRFVASYTSHTEQLNVVTPDYRMGVTAFCFYSASLGSG